MPTIFIDATKKEWDDAKVFFQSNPEKIKYRKNDTPTGQETGVDFSHSFLFIDNILYVVNNTKHIIPEADAGCGSYSRVKYASTEEGALAVIKVEGDNKLWSKIDRRNEFMSEMGQLLSNRTARDIKAETNKKGKLRTLKGIIITTKKKYYTLMKYLGDRDLFHEMGLHIRPFKALQQSVALAYILKVMIGVQRLHNKRIIHADSKPENVMVLGENPTLTITIIDFDFSFRLNKNENNEKLDHICGTDPFIAPEIKSQQEYSFASDVFAIGKMLEELQVNEQFYLDLIDNDPENRPTLWQSIHTIAGYLKNNLNDSSAIYFFVLNTLGEYVGLMREELTFREKAQLDGNLPADDFSLKASPSDLAESLDVQDNPDKLAYSPPQPTLPTYLPALEGKKRRSSLSQSFSNMHIVTLNNKKANKRKNCSIQ